MTRGRWREHPDAEAKEERFYAFIGRYVTAFQWAEAKLDEIILLARGHENWEETQRVLATMSNDAKVDAVCRIVTEDGPFRRIEIDGWYDRAAATFDQLHKERRRRNDFMHAGYMFDFIAGGGPVVAAIRRRGTENNDRFDYDGLTEARQDDVLVELLELCDAVARLHMQLAAVYTG